MSRKPNILFTGDIAHVSMSSFQRCDVLQRLGYEVRRFDYCEYRPAETLSLRLRRRLARVDVERKATELINQKILALRKELNPDLVWMEWPRAFDEETLAALRDAWPKAVFVCFQDDNPFGERQEEIPKWRKFIQNIKFFDLHFVKREEDHAPFLAHGAKRTALAMHGVYRPLFRPPSPGSEMSAAYDVSFVGTALDHRVPFIREMIDGGLRLHVFGRKWYKSWMRWRHYSQFHSGVLGQAYVDVLWGSSICLAFVSSSNRDQYTMRTFEIPGCRAFMLAERTPMHQALFNEGVEADFFSSVEECADKIRYYLRNPEARLKIAAAGWERCHRSNYWLETRMQEAVSVAMGTQKTG